MAALCQLCFHDATAVRASLAWWIDNCLEDRRKTLEFPARVVNRFGGESLLKEPQITLGTIHSVKGGEADVVYLAPDLSPAGMREWCGTPDEQDSVRRCFYVGLTRAFEELVICRPSGGLSVCLT